MTLSVWRMLFLHVDDGATANFFKVKGLEHGGLDVQAHAMARDAATVGAEGSKVVDGMTDAVVHFKQMKAADNTGNACVATNLLCVADDVANAAVGAAGNDKKPVIGAAAEGRVV